MLAKFSASGSFKKSFGSYPLISMSEGGLALVKGENVVRKVISFIFVNPSRCVYFKRNLILIGEL